MKILIIQERGRHAANEKFREALSMQRALTKIGINSVVWGLNYETFAIPFDEISKDCDVILLLENYEIDGWIPDLSKCNKLKIFWSIDSHCNLDQHINTVNNHKINIVLNSIESNIRMFDAKGYYFPNAYDDELIAPKPQIVQMHDVGFCGNILNRGEWIEFLSNNCNFKQDIFVIGDAMITAINSYKMHFNRNISNDVNYRTFETLGAGILLLTNQTENLSNLFHIDEDLVVYNSKDDLLNKIKYYTEHKHERNEIEAKGFMEVKALHTYVNRAIQLYDIIQNNI